MNLPTKTKLLLIAVMAALLVTKVKVTKAAPVLTAKEIKCGVISTYHEARGLSPEHWDRVFKVAVNRKANPRRYGAKSSDLCAIVHSQQYTTHNKRHIKEPRVLMAIAQHIKRGYWKNEGNYAFFHSRHGKMFYRS